MVRDHLRRWLPHKSRFREHKRLRLLGNLLHDPNLWHLNRRSVSGAAFVGLFLAWVPLPVQMLLAAIVALWLRVNLPVAVVLVWITNPITIPPMSYLAYKLGAWLLGRPPQEMQVQLSLEWISEQLGYIWAPMLLGSLLIGLVSAALGFIAIRLLWRLHVIRSWQERKRRRASRPRRRSRQSTVAEGEVGKSD